jgi:hypothetical protein
LEGSGSGLVDAVSYNSPGETEENKEELQAKLLMCVLFVGDGIKRRSRRTGKEYGRKQGKLIVRKLI